MLKILLAICIPPLSVYLNSGPTKRFYLNVVLTLMGLFPGIVHAIWGLTEEKKGFVWTD